MATKKKTKKSTISQQKYLVTSTLVVILFIALIVSLVHRESLYELPLESEETSFLYVQTAEFGSLVPSSDGHWTLTLNDVSPNTIYFSDRPARETGQEPTGDFVADWDVGEESFAEVPPNAALEFIDSTSESRILVLELMNLEYDEELNTIQYEVIILDGDSSDEMTYDNFNQAVLFIDSTYKHYTCDCEIEDGENTCTCRYDYNLKSSATKEFRVTCKHGKYTDIGVADRRKDTTCTTHFMTASFGGDYTSKSCTNWSPTANDHVTVKAICTDDDPRWPGDDSDE